MSNSYTSIGATKNLFTVFSKYRMNKKISKSVKSNINSSKLSKSLNESLNDSGNQNEGNSHIELQHWNLPPKYIEIFQKSLDLNKDIEIKFSKLKELQTKRLLSKFNTEDNKKTDRQIKNIVKELTNKIKESEENIKIINLESTKNNTENLIKGNMKIYLVEKLKEITKELRLNEKQYVSKFKEYVADEDNDYTYNTSNTSNVNFFNTDDRNNNDQNSILEFDNDNNSNSKIGIKERREEINALVKSIDELSIIFKDLQLLVVQQGSILDRIDYNIEESLHNVQKGHKELIQADKNLKSNCARNGIFILIIVVFIEAVMLVFKWT